MKSALLKLLVVSLLLFTSSCAWALPVRYHIDSGASWLQIVPGERPATAGGPVTVGSYFDVTYPVFEQAPGSLRVNLSGFVQGDLSLSRLEIGQGSQIIVENNPFGPFQPPVSNNPTSEIRDNFGARDDLIAPDPQQDGNVFRAAVRNAVVDLTDGALTIGEPADIEFLFSQGRIDYSLLGGFKMDSFPLTDLLVTSNISRELVTGSFDDEIRIPIFVDEAFEVCTLTCPEQNNSSLLIEGLVVVSTLTGDFDGNGELGIDDLDALSDATADQEASIKFDLNLNGEVDQVDIDDWLSIFGTKTGDVDLNGKVDFTDFLTLSDGFGKRGVWSNGNFDTDGVVAFGDFLSLSSNFGWQAEGVSEAVPEPGSFPALLVSIAVLIPFGRSARRPKRILRGAKTLATSS